MVTKNLNVRVDEDLKKQADAIFSALGMSMSTAVTMFLKSTVRCKGFPCDLRLGLPPNAETLQAMEDTEKGLGLSRTFDSVEELMEDLNA
ncbi:MAG TPA: type II toxin-antitoxin system RelB/DinJ family antitoxin [Synergistaceae bacterium]|nr:type II toxin-antitoxin system RelB/DinJ family antitoxin [Synergistaceae bacterium]